MIYASFGPGDDGNAVVTRFVANGLGYADGWERASTIGAFTDRLVAGVVFYGWEPEHGTIKAATYSADKGWMSRGLVGAIGRYVFGQLGCQLLRLDTSERNETVKRICRRIGMNEYRIPRLRGPDEAEITFTYTAEQWAESKFSR